MRVILFGAVYSIIVLGGMLLRGTDFKESPESQMTRSLLDLQNNSSRQ